MIETNLMHAINEVIVIKPWFYVLKEILNHTRQVKVCLYVPSPWPCASKSPLEFNIVSVVTDCLMDRLGSEPILSVTVNLTVTMTETGRRRYV